MAFLLQYKILESDNQLFYCQGKHTDWSLPPWPGTLVTICMSCFTTGGPGKEHRTNTPPPTGRVRERSKGDTTCPNTSQNPPLWHPSWLNKACTTRKDSESEWLAKDNFLQQIHSGLGSDWWMWRKEREIENWWFWWWCHRIADHRTQTKQEAYIIVVMN